MCIYIQGDGWGILLIFKLSRSPPAQKKDYRYIIDPAVADLSSQDLDDAIDDYIGLAWRQCSCPVQNQTRVCRKQTVGSDVAGSV